MGGLNLKGDRRERELVNHLDETGFAVMRAPASGSATERDLPDVLAGNGKTVVAIEAKSSSGAPIYLDASEIDALDRYAAVFGAEPVLGIKFDVKQGDPAWGNDDDTGWRFLQPEDCHRTDGGNYRVKKALALAEGETLGELQLPKAIRVEADQLVAAMEGADG